MKHHLPGLQQITIVQGSSEIQSAAVPTNHDRPRLQPITIVRGSKPHITILSSIAFRRIQAANTAVVPMLHEETLTTASMKHCRPWLL